MIRLAFVAVWILAAGIAPAQEAQNERQNALPRAARERGALERQQNRGNASSQAPGGIRREPFREPLTARKIRTSIDDACLWLRGSQRPDGSFGAGQGETELATLALLAAGADPSSDSGVQKALDLLLKQTPDNTYVRGIRANVWEYALRKAPYEEPYRQALKADFEWLLKALGDKEGWRYNLRSGDWDNSCTQYGVLGIWAAARAGFDPGEKFWRTMSKHFRSCQSPDGGWAYTTGGGTPNMATAGLASMFLVFDMYHGKTCWRAGSGDVFSKGEAAECLASIQRGTEWLGKNHRGGWGDSYFLYGIERTGVASGRKTFGGVDWFREGALSILRSQQQNGAFSLGGHGGPIVGTSFCVLFLVYGGAPVAFDKLEYGEGQDWNLNPRDLANLSKFLWSAYERPLNWQTVSLASGAAGFDAPILFISGSKAPKLSDADVATLRDYLLGGGTILAEPSDFSPDFAKGMEALLGRMFPAKEHPAIALAPLPADHPIYTVLKQEWKARPALRGASDGSRTFFLLSDGYLSSDWQMDKADSDAFKLGLNLLFYATDLRSLEGKYATGLPDSPPAKARKHPLVVARVRTGGGDALAGAASWKRFAPYLAHVVGATLDEKPAVRLGETDLAGIQILHLTGAADFRLAEKERAALKKFLEDGGTLLCDAYAGSEAFAAAARREIEAAAGRLQPLDPSDYLATGSLEGGADLTRNLALKLPARKALRARGAEGKGIPLEIVRIGKRPAVLFSAFDVSGAMAGIESYRSIGFQPSSARKIAANLCALVTAE